VRRGSRATGESPVAWRVSPSKSRLKARLARAHGQEREAQLQEALRRLPERLTEGMPGQRRALVAGLVSGVWIDDDGKVSLSLRGTDLCREPADAREGLTGEAFGGQRCT